MLSAAIFFHFYKILIFRVFRVGGGGGGGGGGVKGQKMADDYKFQSVMIYGISVDHIINIFGTQV